MLMWYSGRSLFQCKQMQKLQRKKFIWRNVFYPIFARISLAFSHSILNAKLQRITLLPSSSTAHGEMKRERERRERKSANKKSDCKITNACMSNGNGDYCYDTRARRESTVHSRTRHTGFEQLQTKWWDDNNNENYSTFVSCKQTHTHSRIRVAFENILFSVWLRHFCTFAVCRLRLHHHSRTHSTVIFMCSFSASSFAITSITISAGTLTAAQIGNDVGIKIEATKKRREVNWIRPIGDGRTWNAFISFLIRLKIED